MAEPDFSIYVGRPKIDAASGVVLARKLIKAAPKKAPEAIKRTLNVMRDAAIEVQKIGVERHRLRPENLRPYDRRWDSGWGGLFDRLAGLARLEGEKDAERARALQTRLFPSNDLSMLTLSFEDEWLEGDKLLRMIEQDKLQREIDELAGAVFLRYIKSAQHDLGEALGVGEREIESASTTGLSEALDELATAIADYARVQLGTIDRQKPATLKAFQKAMAPLDAHRAARATTRTSNEQPVTPVEDAEDPAAEDPSAPIPPVA